MKQRAGFFRSGNLKKGKKMLLMMVLCLLAVVVFAFTGCGVSRLEGHVKIKEYGITGQVDRDAWNKWVPGGCKPEEEEVFINFTADDEFGEIQIGYYMLREWNEVKDENGTVLSETTPTVTDYRAELKSVSAECIQKTDSGYVAKFSGLHKGQYAIRITGVKGSAEEIAEYNKYERQMNAYIDAYVKYKADKVKYEEDLSAYWDNPSGTMPVQPTEPTKPIKPESVAKLEGNNVEVVVRIGGYKDCFDKTGKLIPNDYPVEAA